MSDQLARVAHVERAFAARLALPMRHRDCTAVASSVVETSICGGAAPVASREVVSLASEAARQLQERGTADALHTVALIDLLWADGTGKSIDRAINYLGAAVRLSRESPPPLADLAAAYLVRAERRQDPRDLLASIEFAMRALERDTLDQVAGFNLALALDRLKLYDQARAAWGTYLARPNDSAWRLEAVQRRDRDAAIARVKVPLAITADTPPAIVDSVVASDAQRARLHGWDEVLVAWGDAVLRGDSTTAERALRVAQSLGDALRRHGGDRSLTDAVLVIRKARGESAVRALARGHRAYGRARAAHEATDYPTALAAFETALAGAGRSRPLRLWASLGRGISLAQSGPPGKSASIFTQVITEADEAGYTAAAARARWALATTLMRQNGAEQSVDILKAAARTFADLGERENLGTVEHLEALALVTLDDTRQAFELLAQSLGSLRDSRTSVRLHNALYLLADLASSHGWPRAALAIRREGMQVAVASNDPLNVGEAQIALARARRGLADSVGAAAELFAAERVLGTAAPGIGREWVMADLHLAQAEGEATTRPSAAQSKLDTAVAFFRNIRIPLRFLPALQTRAEVLARLGDVDGATSDLESILNTVRSELRETRDVSLRASLARSAQRAYERLTLLELERGRPTEALAALERGRTLLDGVRDESRDGERSRIGRDVGRIVDYALMSDTLLTWVIDGRSVSVHAQYVRRDSVLAVLGRIRSLMELHVDASTVRGDLSRLHEWMIQPIEQAIPRRGERLTIIADGELADAPLAAAYDARRDEYLVERATIEFTGSMSSALDPSGKRREVGPLTTALLVGDPAFARERYPALGRLPESRVEVSEIAALYAKRVVLIDSAASSRDIRRSLPGAQVFHFAGHLVLDEDQVTRSELVLASDGASSTPFTLDSVSRLDLHQVNLVVLSACESAREPSGRVGGFLGIAAAFRRAGARHLVGSIWRVDDASTRELMSEFHRFLHASGDPAVALRNTQLSLLASPNARLRTPATWAAFRYVVN